MYVDIVSAVFPPEPVVSARTSANLSRILFESGYAVRVLAPYPSRPTGKRYPGYPGKLFWRYNVESGYEIVYCPSIPSTKSTLLSRLLENLAFGLTAVWQILFHRPRPDLIYSNTWPLFASGFLVFAARLLRIPVVLSVQDVYPESLVLQNRINPVGWTYRFLRRLDCWIAKSCQAVVVLSDDFARLYEQDRGVARERVHVVPNWASEGFWTEKQDIGAVALRNKYRIPPDNFLLVYAGNIGAAAGIETLLESFRLVQDLIETHLLLAGEGSHLANCQRMVQERSIERVYFHHPWLIGETASVLLAADALLLPTQGAQSRASLPSKLMDYLFAGRPMIVSAEPGTELGRIVRQAGCGWVIDPDRSDILAQSIRDLVNMPRQLLRQMGSAGREYGHKNFSKDACLQRLVEIIESVAKA